MKSLNLLLAAYREMGVEFLNRVEFKTKEELLTEIRGRVESCMRCPLYKTRTKAVFGEGNPNAKIMFVGEAPGKDEDLQGRPFVGRAGRLLRELLARAGISEDSIYIGNCLKCRPPNNRDPSEYEIEMCSPYLTSQIEIIDPAVIVTLGRYSTGLFVGLPDKMSKLRGRIFEYGSKKVVVMYHPAYLLRNPGAIQDFTRDLQRIKELIDEDSH